MRSGAEIVSETGARGQSMSFLDNLENNLKALENQEEKNPEKVKRDQERREAERASALLRAPHAEALKNSEFTSTAPRTPVPTIGREQRVLVQFTWIGRNLRLDAAAKRLELTPTAEGIVAVFSLNGAEASRGNGQPPRRRCGRVGAPVARGVNPSSLIGALRCGA